MKTYEEAVKAREEAEQRLYETRVRWLGRRRADGPDDFEYLLADWQKAEMAEDKRAVIAAAQEEFNASLIEQAAKL